MANITGTSGHDEVDQWAGWLLLSTTGDDTIDTLGGDDYAEGGWGNDIIHGGADKDKIAGHDDDITNGAYYPGNWNPFANGYVDDDILFGDGGDDTISDWFGNDKLYGGDDNDSLLVDFPDLDHAYSFVGDVDELDGGKGTDSLAAYQGTDILHGGEGNDWIFHGVGVYFAGSTLLYSFGDAHGYAYGDEGDDTLRGGATGTWFYGGTGNDTIAAHAGDDIIDGGDDNDLIVAGTGADDIRGGSGDDDIYTYGTQRAEGLGNFIEAWELNNLKPQGDIAVDTVDGGAGNDRIYADAGDVINGGDDADVLSLSVLLEEITTATTFDGGNGNDRAALQLGELEQHEGGDGVDFITPITFVLDPDEQITLFGLTLISIEAITFFSGKGDDELTGWIFDDDLIGGGGSDKLHGRDGDDRLYGGSSDDILDGGRGNDLLDGGDDILDGIKYDTDTVDYSLHPFALPILVDLVAGTGQVGLSSFPEDNDHDTLVSVENVIGNSKNDIIKGDEQKNKLEGRDGNDLLSGAGGEDRLIGGAGDDVIEGGDGTDDLEGGEGSDTLVYLDYADESHLLVVNLAHDASNADGIEDFESIVGSALKDTFTGSAERNVIFGMAGNDIITAINTHLPGGGLAKEWDVLDGGEGEDRITGSLGTAVLAGGAGHDVIEGGDGDEKIFGGSAPADIEEFFAVHFTPDPDDPLGLVSLLEDFLAFVLGVSNDPYFLGVTAEGLDAWEPTNTDTVPDILSGGLGKDLIFGAQGNDVINGDGGNDDLLGYGGIDTLNGGSGDDTISGFEGDDIIDGGSGVDWLAGGEGNDTFLVRTFHRDPDIIEKLEHFWGGGGIDTIDFSDLGAPIQVQILNVDDPEDADWKPDTQISIRFGSEDRLGQANSVENYIGSTGDDAFTDRNNGSPANRFEGRGGADKLDGGGGNDELLGGSQNDTLIGGAGDDTLDGGSGVDTAKFSGTRSAYTITHLSDGRTRVAGPDGTDTLTSVEKLAFDDDTNVLRISASRDYSSDAPSYIDTIQFAGAAVATFASAQFGVGVISPDVTVIGNAAANGLVINASGAFSMAGWTFTSWSADDTVTVNGSAAADTITGSSQTDTLAGGAGGDTLEGGAGADKLTGEAGSDRFVFTAAALADAQATTPLIDWITDFNRGNGSTFNAGEGDRIDVAALVSASLAGGQQVGNLVRVLSDGTNTRLQVDTDGTANGAGWVSLARLDGLQAGHQLGVLVDGTASAQLITVLGSETINNHDGSRVEHRVDALDQHAYRDYFITYDALNRVTSQLTNNDDGSHLNQVWDVQSQSDWANYYITYDSQSRIVGQVTLNDDSSTIVLKWDVASAEDWADYYVTYDGQNRPITQVTHNDDGSRIVFKWDRDNTQEWSDYRVTYDSQDRPITQVTNNDDGSRIVFKWDLDNQFSWSDYRVTDKLGQSISQVTNNDDGTHVTYGWDANNQASWSDYMVTTDNQNRATEQTTHYDDGTYTVAKWDVQNQFGWREMTDYYDAQGQQLQQRGVYDDGTPWVI
jgi:Ca2+-binding RTX toxin-like protein